MQPAVAPHRAPSAWRGLLLPLASAALVSGTVRAQPPEETVHTTETERTVADPGGTEATRTTETVRRTKTTAPRDPYDPWRGHTMRPRIALRPMIGVAGTARLDRVEGRSDLNASYGGAIELEVPVLPILSLGGEVAVMAWRSDVDQLSVNRNILTSISLVPRLRLPFEGARAHGALYLAVPVGLSINAMDETYGEHLDIGDGSFRIGVGYNIAGRVGAQLFFSPRVGITTEIEYRYHAFWHSLDAPLIDDDNVSMRLHQLLLHVGVVFAL
jgi:hypothetical protein